LSAAWICCVKRSWPDRRRVRKVLSPTDTPVPVTEVKIAAPGTMGSWDIDAYATYANSMHIAAVNPVTHPVTQG